MAKRKRRLKKGARLAFIFIAFVLIFALFFTLTILQKRNQKEDGVVDESIDSSQAGRLPVEEQEEGTLFSYTVFSCGQGQSIFVKYGTTEVLIDGGDAAFGPELVKKLEGQIDGDLEYVISTTPDKTYCGGLSSVYSAYSVANTIYASEGKSEEYKAFKEAATGDGQRAYMEGKSETIQLGSGCTLRTVPSEGERGLSIATIFTFGKRTFITTSDMDAEREQGIRGKLTQSSVTVASRNGAKDSNTLLAEMAPAYFVINSDGSDPENLLYVEGSQNYITSLSGDISFTTNGEDLNLLADTKTQYTGK